MSTAANGRVNYVRAMSRRKRRKRTQKKSSTTCSGTRSRALAPVGRSSDGPGRRTGDSMVGEETTRRERRRSGIISKRLVKVRMCLFLVVCILTPLTREKGCSSESRSRLLRSSQGAPRNQTRVRMERGQEASVQRSSIRRRWVILAERRAVQYLHKGYQPNSIHGGQQYGCRFGERETRTRKS